MTKPATDEDLKRIERKLDRIAHPVRLEIEHDIAALIARIRSEQEARRAAEARAATYKAWDFPADLQDLTVRLEAAEALASSIREKTIRECAEVAKETFSGSNPHSVLAAILALLEQKP